MRIERYSVHAGLITPVVMILFILLAASLKADFSWADDSLSSIAGNDGDTPYYTATGPPAVVFNIGMFVSGVVFFVFAYGLRRSGMFKGRLGRMGANLYLLPGILLALVGVFPNPLSPTHDIVSHSLFIMNPIAMAVIGVSLLRTERTLGILSTFLGVVALVPFFLRLPWDGLAIPEMMALLPSVVFIWIFSYNLHRHDGPEKKMTIPDDSEE